eukprot:TRINITY_DN60058_c0_g1_i1.p2 TRINITY_DN60058_c0_g1~~TRINITY_DN60058_c0_g1_i1.p2  ORF type:complete len:292 (+),score=85.07 TRINITY_DN60058_c0_g1_i1:86-961(+)
MPVAGTAGLIHGRQHRAYHSAFPLPPFFAASERVIQPLGCQLAWDVFPPVVGAHTLRQLSLVCAAELEGRRAAAAGSEAALIATHCEALPAQEAALRAGLERRGLAQAVAAGEAVLRRGIAAEEQATHQRLAARAAAVSVVLHSVVAGRHQMHRFGICLPTVDTPRAKVFDTADVSKYSWALNGFRCLLPSRGDLPHHPWCDPVAMRPVMLELVAHLGGQLRYGVKVVTEGDRLRWKAELHLSYDGAYPACAFRHHHLGAGRAARLYGLGPDLLAFILDLLGPLPEGVVGF